MGSMEKHFCDDMLKAACQIRYEVLKETGADFKVRDMAVMQSHISFESRFI